LPVNPPAAAQLTPVEPPVDEEGARKHVSVLFADLRGATQLIADLDPEAAMLQLDPAIEAMCQAVAAAGGIVTRIEGDGVMALFGVPIAREDHAVRACLAARQAIARVAQVNPILAVRVGVASGDVVIRRIGRGSADWDAVGVTPHLARRMEQFAAPGSVVIAASTAALVRGFADVIPLGPIAVKGIAKPVEVFELRSASARPAWEVRAAAHALNRFVGREAELAQLAAAATRASFGRGRVVTIIADAGVGKSRLLHEFLRALPSGAWHVLRLAAISHAANAAYHLAAELLRTWIGVEPADERWQIGRKLSQAIAAHGDAHRDAHGGNGVDPVPLRALLDLPVEDAEWPTLEPPARRARIEQAMRLAILREASVQPLVLLVEDLHWADEPSLELLGAIIDGLGAARLLLVATTRPGFGPGSGGDGRKLRWASRSYSSEIVLNPLSAEEADVFLGDLLGSGEALAGLRREIIARTEGTPLFLEEVARSLNERAQNVDDSTHASLKQPVMDIEIPASIQAVLMERFDRLPPDRRRVLQLASVIGKDVPLGLLRSISDLPEAKLAAELAELQKAEIIYELHLPSGAEYTFKHALTQTVAYEGMLRRVRRDLHAKALAAIEALYPDRIDEMLERLAEHAIKGEVWPQAYSYALRAGRRASNRWAWREAIGFLDQAIACLAHLPQTPQTTDFAIEARLDLRIALGAVGDFPRIGQCLSEARSLVAGGHVVQAAGQQARLAQIDTSRCIAFSLLGQLGEAIEAGQQALGATTLLDEPAGFLNAVFALGQAHWYRGDIAEATRVLQLGLGHVRGPLRLQRTGTTGTASVLHLVCISKTYALAGEPLLAASFAAEARDIAEAVRRPYDLAYARVADGFHHYILGDYPAAVTALEAGLETSRSSGIMLLVSSIARYLGHSYAALGRRQEALALLNEALAQSQAHGLVAFRVWCELGLAHAYLPDAAAALPRFEGALALARQHGYRPVEAMALHRLGLLGEARAERQMAAERLQKAVSLAEQCGLRPLAAQVRRTLIERGEAAEGRSAA
jgi:class 3 adenylate cyclase/tetratricopeptide (TPR) repeat protein